MKRKILAWALALAVCMTCMPAASLPEMAETVPAQERLTDAPVTETALAPAEPEAPAPTASSTEPEAPAPTASLMEPEAPAPTASSTEPEAPAPTASTTEPETPAPTASPAKPEPPAPSAPAVLEPSEAPAVDASCPVSENAAFTAGLAKMRRESGVFAGIRDAEPALLLGRNSIVYVIERPEMGQAGERVAVAWCDGAHSVAFGYIAARDLLPVLEVLTQGDAQYKQVKLPLAEQIQPERPAAEPEPATEQPAQETSAPAVPETEQLAQETSAPAVPSAEEAAETVRTTASAGQALDEQRAQTNAVGLGAPVLSGEMMAGRRVTASIVVTAGAPYVFNYWLVDAAGAIVLRNEYTTDTSWTFTAPAQGSYLLCVYGTDFLTEAYAYSAWLAIAPGGVTIADVRVEGDARQGRQLTVSAEVTGGVSACIVNYWLIDQSGAFVDQHLYTTDTSWTFTAPAPGPYLVCVYATDFVTETYASSAWFQVQASGVRIENVRVAGALRAEQPLTVSAEVAGGGQRCIVNYWLIDANGAVVDQHLYTTDTSWTFTAPAGVYFVNVYATDFVSEVYACSAWFTVEAQGVRLSNIRVAGEAQAGSPLTVSAEIAGNGADCIVNYWLIDQSGAFVDQHLYTTDTSWTFTAPAAGNYVICLYATDFVTECYAYSEWFSVAPAPLRVTGVTVAGEQKAGLPITIRAEVAGAGAGAVYSFWLIDQSGRYVAAHTNAAEPAWTLNAPGAGAYAVFAAVSFQGQEANGVSAWFSIAANAVALTGIAVTPGAVYGQAVAVAPQVAGGSGAYAFSYWLFDDGGNVVDRLENTTDAAWCFAAPEAGAYVVRVYATDYATGCYRDSERIIVAPQVALSMTQSEDRAGCYVGNEFLCSAAIAGVKAGSHCGLTWALHDRSTDRDVLTSGQTALPTWTAVPSEPGDYELRLSLTIDGITTLVRGEPFTLLSYPVAPGQEVTFENVVYRADDAGWTIVGHQGATSEVTISARVYGRVVHAVGERAFENATALVKLHLPDSITVIGRRAFAGCTQLSEMD